MDKWREGRWATVETEDGAVTPFIEVGQELVMPLFPRSKVIYRQGWGDNVDLFSVFIADPFGNRLHKF